MAEPDLPARGLTGIAAGVGVGALYGLGRAAGWRPRLLVGALAATLGGEVAGNAPMTLLGVTDPQAWPPSSWAADLLPHLAYGFVTASVVAAH